MAEHDCTEAALNKLVEVVRQNEREKIANRLNAIYANRSMPIVLDTVLSLVRGDEDA